MGLISMRVIKADTTMHPRHRGVPSPISLATLFFGAMMYIAKAPNFMGKNITAQADAECPDFLAYRL